MLFIIDAARLLDVGQARVKERGTGSPHDPPTRMLDLLIVSSATGRHAAVDGFFQAAWVGRVLLAQGLRDFRVGGRCKLEPGGGHSHLTLVVVARNNPVALGQRGLGFFDH